MKTISFKVICAAFVFAMLFCSCAPKQAGVLGVNATVSQIDYDTKVLTVSPTEQSADILAENCLIDCNNISVIYCNFDTEETAALDFSDLQVGDEVLLSFSAAEQKNAKNGNAKPDSVQLYTQRFNG